MWPKSKWNLTFWGKILKIEVNCDFKYQYIHPLHHTLIPDDWVRSHDCFHFASFLYDFNDLWDAQWGKWMQLHLHPQRTGRKMDGWRAMSRPWGQVSRVDGQNQTDKVSQWNGGGVKRESTKSEKPSKKQDMDESQGKWKAHSLWKHKRLREQVPVWILAYISAIKKSKEI